MDSNYLQLKFDDAGDNESDAGQDTTGGDALQGGQQSALGEQRVHQTLEDRHQRQNQQRVGDLQLVRFDGG